VRRATSGNVALRAGVVALMTHRWRALPDHECSLLMTREALERRPALDSMRNGRWGTLVGAQRRAGTEHLCAVLVSLPRNLVVRTRERRAQSLERTLVEGRVRSSSRGAQLFVTGGGARGGRLRRLAVAALVSLLCDTGEEADEGDRDTHRPEHVDRSA
jgi:hypothetical protein